MQNLKYGEIVPIRVNKTYFRTFEISYNNSLNRCLAVLNMQVAMLMSSKQYVTPKTQNICNTIKMVLKNKSMHK